MKRTARIHIDRNMTLELLNEALHDSSRPIPPTTPLKHPLPGPPSYASQPTPSPPSVSSTLALAQPYRNSTRSASAPPPDSAPPPSPSHLSVPATHTARSDPAATHPPSSHLHSHRPLVPASREKVVSAGSLAVDCPALGRRVCAPSWPPHSIRSFPSPKL